MKLKLYLVKNKITNVEFAKIIGCHRVHLGSMMNGRRPYGKLIARIIEIETNGEITAKELLQKEEE